MLSDVTRASTSQLLGGIIDIAKKYSYSIKIFSMSGDNDVLDTIRDVVAEQVDGILLLNDELDTKQMNIIKEQASNANIPLVLTNVISEDPDLPSVAIDYKKASYETCKELINKGKKDIYLLTTVTKYSVNTLKELGYTEAMKESGLEPRIFRTSGDLSINTPHFEEYFDTHKVDGAIAVRDSIAVSFMNVMINKGFKVPEQISVVGYQNTKYAMLARPKLTCIDTPVYDIGAVAMRLLTKLIKSEQVDSVKVVLPYKMIRRESL
jgi:LacI family transcriptional regulator